MCRNLAKNGENQSQQINKQTINIDPLGYSPKIRMCRHLLTVYQVLKSNEQYNCDMVH